MFIFCFNDCIPQNQSAEVADRCLVNSLKEYHYLTQQFPTEIDGIVTSHSSSSVTVTINRSLCDCIRRINERELRQYAHSVFRKYPVDLYYTFGDETELVDNEFHISIDNCHYNAMHPFVVFKNGGILFSLAVHADICQNQLSIFRNDSKVADIDNLYGDNKNTNYIAGIISKSRYDNADNFNKLLITVGINKFSTRFRKNFESFPVNIQKSIINHFRDAKNRYLPTPFAADKKLIKDVTPDKELEIKVFELRIFEPVACRVYFYESDNCIYLGTVENKPNKKTQSNHIITARNIIKEMVFN